MENWGKQSWVTKHERSISKTRAALAEVYWSAWWFCRKIVMQLWKWCRHTTFFISLKYLFPFIFYLSGGKTYQPALVKCFISEVSGNRRVLHISFIVDALTALRALTCPVTHLFKILNAETAIWYPKYICCVLYRTNTLYYSVPALWVLFVN